MNIVYAVKIFLALAVMAGVTRLIAGRGLRLVMTPHDWKTGWWGILGTLAVSCFSLKPMLFFIVFPCWALYLSRLFGLRGTGRLAAYALLACVAPPAVIEVEHIGPLNDLMQLTPFRLCGIVLLIPEGLRLMSRRDQPKTPTWLTVCDVATLGYMLYWMVRLYSGFPMSSILRQALALAFDTVVPYYVVSRACATPEVRRRFMSVVLMGAVYEAFVGMAESTIGHYLYAQLQWLYGVGWGQSFGLMRGSWLRAEAAFPGPLALAMLLMFAIGLWFVLKPQIKSRLYLVVLLALVGGLLATYGRGPLIATLVLFASVWLMRRLTGRHYLIVAAVTTVVVSLAWSAGLGDAVIAVVGKVSAGDETADFNVQYRQELVNTSLALLQQSPWWGVPNFIAQMEALRQGEGIIDLVNTYLIVALNVGLVGLSVFMLPYGITLLKEVGRTPQSDTLQREGRVWLALTVAMMIAIFTVSPISVIQPLMIWTIALALGRLQERQAVATPPRRSAMYLPPAFDASVLADEPADGMPSFPR